MSRPTIIPTLWILRKVSIKISLSIPRKLTCTDTFTLLWISCFRNHYIFPPETECFGPDKHVRTAQVDLGRYITQSPYSWFSRGKAHIKEMLRSCAIRDSDSPISSIVVLVRKTDNFLRFVLDHKKLNSRTRKDAYMLPRFDDTVDVLIGAK